MRIFSVDEEKTWSQNWFLTWRRRRIEKTWRKHGNYRQEQFRWGDLKEGAFVSPIGPIACLAPLCPGWLLFTALGNVSLVYKRSFGEWVYGLNWNKKKKTYVNSEVCICRVVIMHVAPYSCSKLRSERSCKAIDNVYVIPKRPVLIPWIIPCLLLDMQREERREN